MSFLHDAIMPVDRSTINTTARIAPALLKDPYQFASQRQIPLRGHHFISVPGRTFGRTRNGIVLHLLKFRGLKVTILPILREGFSNILIDFNPGVILYGHNGRILREAEFCDALAIVSEALSQLLEDPEDWRRLIPGLQPDSPSYWASLEIPLHCQDPNGEFLQSFRNARHPFIRKSARHWETSMLLPGCNMKLSVYQKGEEMAAGKKLSEEELQNFKNVLRIEVRLRKGKLLDYLGGPGNTSVIDGVDRIVRFHGSDLVEILRQVLGQIRGVFRDDEKNVRMPTTGHLADLGRFIAKESLSPEVRQPFHVLLEAICLDCRVPGKARNQLRKGGLELLSEVSLLGESAQFLNAALPRQPHVISGRLERMTRHDPPPQHMLDAIRRAYSAPSQTFYPHLELSSYF